MSTFPISAGSRTRDTVRHEPARRRLTVLDRHRITPTIVRFVLGGDDLASFASLGPEDHVKVFVPEERGSDRLVGRDYTPSEFRRIGASSGPELDLDFVVHEGTGPAMTWAMTASPGDVLEVGGPRGSRLAPGGFGNVLLVADQSGMPALRRWIRAFGGATRVHAVLFGGDPALPSYLDETETLAATPQLALDGGPELAEVVRQQDVTADTFVWAAGEAGALVPVRRLLKDEFGLPPENRSLHGYWRRGVAGLDHHAPLDPDDPD